ncbi:hypothetical protein NHX12_030219 [Muraenolepis orangiensis]|uniref:Uncharacterized protein n=1 Tax=Muraenolepis orangiensis TaxID=630683 RepID=A0A9Q0E7R2_9TELE|nr:hypothetical protein NHX12_030219 [Muraenolepis orangiensis]
MGLPGIAGRLSLDRAARCKLELTFQSSAAGGGALRGAMLSLTVTTRGPARLACDVALDQRLENSAWRTAPGEQRLENIAWRTAPGEQRLENSAWRTSPGEHRLENIAWRTVPGEHRLENSAWRTAPGEQCLESTQILRQFWTDPQDRRAAILQHLNELVSLCVCYITMG